jgi:hypothetical protein
LHFSQLLLVTSDKCTKFTLANFHLQKKPISLL